MIILIICLIQISISDISSTLIPNKILIIIVIVGFMFLFIMKKNVLLHMGISVLFIGFFIIINLVKTHSFGYGDIKLVGGLSLFLNLTDNIYSIFISLVLALEYIVIFKLKKKERFSFGPFIALGYLPFIIKEIFSLDFY
ncbi:MAG: prepilin peptidase [Lachnospiraceae bacterium]|jgi:Flp pilus assembly protein protease CpaA|nr:prepilin peptidase [Lachnospiraceae bacterium]